MATVASALSPAAPVPARRRIPRALLAASLLVAALLLLPLAFLALQARGVGWPELSQLLFRRLTLNLLWNVVRLGVVVTALAAVIGTGAAWCVERSDLPGRRVLALLLILPLAIPDFVVAFGWVSVLPGVSGFGGAVLVMTAGLYPLVYLPVAASLRGADPSQEETARTLGLSSLGAFRRVTLRQARPTILAGCLLVSLALLAEYGAFEILGYQTFTTEIFTEFQVGFNAPAACALSLVVVLIGLLVLSGEGALRDRGRVARSGNRRGSSSARVRLGAWRWPALALLLAVIGVALGMPLGVITYWLLRGGGSTLPQGASVASAAGITLLYSGAAAAVATVLAIPVALLAVRNPRPGIRLLERSTYIVQGLPGLVIALGLVFFALHYLPFLYQTSGLLVAAYAILFFPLAYVAVRASVLHAPPALEEVGRSLGGSPLMVRWRVTLPLIAPGLAAAFCLVFLSAVTELTATLILVPTGVQTLATQFWAYTGNVSYGAAAPYAAAMVVISIVPGLLLGRRLDRRPASAEAAP
ncbi:MAG TPA: iron ABC transporter permease [Candidatus Dormibacteraeota bacterium]|nr:iron ABC transporter permease [Candidatus Dormibacteraeota bacterium]